MLSAFRQWLLAAEAWRVSEEASRPGPAEEPVDLHTLVREWIALKQEFRLASRSEKATRQELTEAVGAFREGLGRVGDELRGALEAMVRESARAREELRARLEAQEREWAELLFDARETVARALDACRQVSQRLGWRAWFLPKAMFAALLEGHDLALRRIDAALESRGIHPIECEGRPADPERMHVVDVVRRDDLSPGQVVEVLRRGYVRDGRVLRYAEVRAAARREADSGAPASDQGTEQPEE